jgi:hypothetical protein
MSKCLRRDADADHLDVDGWPAESLGGRVMKWGSDS